MDEEQIQSSMLDGMDFLGRLDAIEARVAEHARRETPSGLTEPDPGGDERWEANQVWAHMAEFVGYWGEQIQGVVADYDGEPVAFGRVKTDPGRIAAIEVGRHEPIHALVERVRESLAETRRFLAQLTTPEWSAVGRHPVRGDMDVEAMVGQFIVSHLEEHLDQLDGLAASAD
jgi:hypothetical protein